MMVIVLTELPAIMSADNSHIREHANLWTRMRVHLVQPACVQYQIPYNQYLTIIIKLFESSAELSADLGIAGES